MHYNLLSQNLQHKIIAFQHKSFNDVYTKSRIYKIYKIFAKDLYIRKIYDNIHLDGAVS